MYSSSSLSEVSLYAVLVTHVPSGLEADEPPPDTASEGQW